MEHLTDAADTARAMQFSYLLYAGFVGGLALLALVFRLFFRDR